MIKKNRLNGLFQLSACLAAGSLCSLSVRAADPGKLTINVGQPGAKIATNFYGLMTEEINYSYDGGLYAELIQNRIFQNPAGGGGRRGGGGGAGGAAAGGPAAVPHWSVFTSGNGGAGTIAVDTADPVNTGALKNSLRLDITSAEAAVGVANDGFWGIPVKPNTTFTATFYARSGNGFSGQLTAAIVGNDGKVYASGKADVGEKNEETRKKKLLLKTAADVKPTADAKFVISGNAKGSVWVSLVSLFPPVFKERTGAALGSRPVTGFRPDIMQLLEDMHPTYLRFPGGNYVEGPNFANRFDFKITVGPWEDRPGHMSPWNYRSSDGMGLLEFLLWCEDLKMDPVLAVYAGLNIDGGRDVKTGDALKPLVQDALDEIEYVSGDKSTQWGGRRAKDGHPEPFKLTYVEIGNEDNLNGGAATYDERFTAFFDGIKAKYPKLQCIATTNVRARVPDVIDRHNYMPPQTAINNAHMFDNTNRNGPKIFEGEWASQEPGGNQRPLTPTYQCAVSDAAFMTGLERNADIVVMECYAPLLTRVEPGGSQWHTNLIGYNALTSYGSPPYYVQKMFNTNRGDVVLPIVAQFLAGSLGSCLGPWPAGAMGMFDGTGLYPVAAGGARAGGGAGGRGARGRGGAGAAGGGGNLPLFASASKDDATGDIIVKVVNVRDAAQDIEVELQGRGDDYEGCDRVVYGGEAG